MNLGVDEIYVINLNRHKLRKKRVSNNLNNLNLDFKFVEAIDGQSHAIDYSVLNPTFYDPNGLFTKGIICCALSHRKAWKEFLDSGKDTALFLEDDVKPTKYLKNLDLDTFNTELKQLDWGVCWVGKYYEDITVYNNISSLFYSNETFVKHQYAAHSYILNRKSAKWFYKSTEKIKYAADIRLEICPFPQITTDKSLFIQRHKELEKHYDTIKNNKRYNYLKEWLHYTLKDGNTHHNDKKGYYNNSLPIISKEYKDIEILGKKVNWCEFILDV